MDLIRQALQTTWECFFPISESFFFFLITTLFLNNSGVGFRHARWGRHLWSSFQMRIISDNYLINVFYNYFSYIGLSWLFSYLNNKGLETINIY